jgi:hypothetical protein
MRSQPLFAYYSDMRPLAACIHTSVPLAGDSCGERPLLIDPPHLSNIVAGFGLDEGHIEQHPQFSKGFLRPS